MLKFHTIARYQLVSIFKKCKPQSEMGVVDSGALPGVPATPTVATPALPPPAPPTPVTPAPPPTSTFDRPGDKEDKQTFQVSDCRSLVKTLVCGVKTITWGITSCKAPGGKMVVAKSSVIQFGLSLTILNWFVSIMWHHRFVDGVSISFEFWNFVSQKLNSFLTSSSSLKRHRSTSN